MGTQPEPAGMLVFIGGSVRALTEAAVRAGLGAHNQLVAVDFFGDRETRAAADRWIPLTPDPAGVHGLCAFLRGEGSAVTQDRLPSGSAANGVVSFVVGWRGAMVVGLGRATRNVWASAWANACVAGWARGVTPPHCALRRHGVLSAARYGSGSGDRELVDQGSPSRRRPAGATGCVWSGDSPRFLCRGACCGRRILAGLLGRRR